MEERRKETTGSLCWLCRRVGIECEKPVEGWNAEYNPLRSFEGDYDIPSWFVRECPEFEPDRKEDLFVRPTEKLPKTKLKRKEPPNLKRYLIFGEMLTSDEVSKRYGITKTAFRSRMRRGATPEEAVSKKDKESRLKHYDIFGESLTVKEIVEKYHVKERTFRQRLYRGISPEDAITSGKKIYYILIGSCVETGEVRKWFDPKDACEAGLGFEPDGISRSITKGLIHKGWIFKRKAI